MEINVCILYVRYDYRFRLLILKIDQPMLINKENKPVYIFTTHLLIKKILVILAVRDGKLSIKPSLFMLFF